MNKKYFIIGGQTAIDAGEKERLRSEKELLAKAIDEKIWQANTDKIRQEDNLTHVDGRVVVKIDHKYKNSHTFSNGQKIRLERQFNNFNKRETEPVNALVISGEGIQQGAEILIHPNAVHAANKINNYKDSNEDVGYYSIESDMCFAWHDGREWQPIPPFDFALRVFKPYDGVLSGIEPKELIDTLYVTTGKLKGCVVKTIKASDYVIVFQDRDGREGNLLRFRPYGDEKNKREEEAIAILWHETGKVNKGDYLVGITLRDCKPKPLIAEDREI